MFQNEKDVEIFFEFLNCQRKNIKFTLEKENIKFQHFLTFLSKMKSFFNISLSKENIN